MTSPLLNACRCDANALLEAPIAAAVAGARTAPLPQLKCSGILTVLRNSLWHEGTCGFVTAGTRIGTSIPQVGTANPPICHLKSSVPSLSVTADTVTAFDPGTSVKVTRSVPLADTMEANHA